jgi:capsule polysaccharide export protein KpsC/LpsZ
MEEQVQTVEQPQDIEQGKQIVFSYKGKYFDISNITEDEKAMIQNMDIVQKELLKAKTAMDIIQIALNALMNDFDQHLESEECQLIEIVPTTVEDSDVTEGKVAQPETEEK